jgi:hypothetical protein
MDCIGLGQTRQPGPVCAWILRLRGRRLPRCCRRRCGGVSGPRSGLKLAHLNVVGIHRVLLDVSGLVDLVDEDLGVAIGDESLDSKGNSDARPMDQGLVLGTVVGRLLVDL